MGVEAQPDLPPYAAALAAYNRAHAAELRTMIRALPLAPADRVLDVACGDGSHLLHIAACLAERGDNEPAQCERETPRGQGVIYGIDAAAGYVGLARRRLDAARVPPGSIRVLAASADALPFTAGSFDILWCAHSLYSLSDPMAALAEMHRVTRGGGRIALLEQDSLHRIILPWPAEIELAVRQAQLHAMQTSSPGFRKCFVGRHLVGLLRDRGFGIESVRPFCSMRRAPLNADERAYLAGYLADVHAKAEPYLTPAMRDRVADLLDPESPGFLPDQPDFFVTYLDVLAVGVKP